MIFTRPFAMMTISNRRGLVVTLIVCVIGAAFAAESVKRRNMHPVDGTPAEVASWKDNSSQTSPNQNSSQISQIPLTQPAIDPSVIAGGGGASSGGNLTVEGTIGQSADGTAMAGGQFTQVGGFWQPGLGVMVSPSPTPTSTPTPDPLAPVIFIEEGTINKALALDSVTFVRDSFPIFTDHNFSGDHHTRVLLFTSNLGMSQPDPSILTVQAGGFNLTIENVGATSGFLGGNASYIVVRLLDGLPAGDLPVTVTLQIGRAS